MGVGGGCCCWPKEGSIPENEPLRSFSGRGVGLGGGRCQGGVVMVAREGPNPENEPLRLFSGLWGVVVARK